jgi:hypothetical protein
MKVIHTPMAQAVCAGFLLAAVSAFPQTSPGAAALLARLSLPPAGLAPSETAQVNITNTAPQSSTAPSCGGTVAFYNSSGSIIGAPTSFTVGLNQIASVKLPYALADAAGSRTVIRAEIVLTTSPPAGASGVSGPAPSCAVGWSLETYDTATGVTHVFFSGAAQQGLPIWRTSPVPAFGR